MIAPTDFGQAFEIANQLLLLGIDANHGLPIGLMFRPLFLNVFELLKKCCEHINLSLQKRHFNLQKI